MCSEGEYTNAQSGLAGWPMCHEQTDDATSQKQALKIGESRGT